LGKRFLALAAGLIERPSLERQGDVHLATAFGLAGAALDMEPAMVASAYLHQTIFGAISACQRLMPLGQSSAMRLLWALKPGMIEAVEAAGTATNEGLWNLQPMLEIASMRHPHLTTRLFIS
jgi:urease accessory protein